MAEETLWSGTSSQLKNLGAFCLCILVIPIPWAIYRWLKVKTTNYRLTTERLITECGIFTRTTEMLELYRVRDLQVVQPFILRMFGLQNLRLITSDASTPSVTLDYIPKGLGLAEIFRKEVEECRMRKRVRGVDLEGVVDTDDHGLHL